ncbi:MAG: Ig-like domain-containing protein [Muribaculaceae bacterium]|nr:Ig-like domain-containing protein [Muribaculaceae bacterium]
MKKSRISNITRAFVVIATTTIIVSCASMSSPTGGPRDYDPPVFKKSNPSPNQTEVKNNKITLEFDEVIQLDNPGENVIISPPQREMPKIKANLKKIDIELIDSLKPNTSYTLDFGSAIKDNNEGNILNGFSMAFSTGKELDTLQISGTILNAENLEPIKGMTIGLHHADNDTAFTTLPFIRVTRSDIYGNFSIKNVASGKYKIYAVKDADRNYKFNAPTEDIAFLDEVIIPSAEVTSHTDTIYSDTTHTEIDTIMVHNITRFYPDSLTLFSFNEGHKPIYLSKHDRRDREKLSVEISGAIKKTMTLTPVNFEAGENWLITERNITNDTLLFWLSDSLVYNLDTLRVVADYLKTDSILNIIEASDTLNFIFRENPMTNKSNNSEPSTPQRRGRRAKIDTLKTESLAFDQSIPGTIDIYSSPSIRFEAPLSILNKELISLKTKEDSTWVSIKDWKLENDSLSPRRYIVKYKWDFDKKYILTFDSAAVTSIYGLSNDSTSFEFKVKKSSEYSNLYVETIGVKSGAFAELLDSKDTPVRYASIKNGGAEFPFVKPGKYYIRLVIDSDNNKKFTPGRYKDRRQPEQTYYYPKLIELKPNWDVEQSWDVFATPITKQKPYELIKNKPKNDPKAPKKEEVDDEPIYSNRPSAKF